MLMVGGYSILDRLRHFESVEIFLQLISTLRDYFYSKLRSSNTGRLRVDADDE